MSDPTPTTAAPGGLTGSWVLDPAKTTVVFHTKAMWVLNVLGTARAISGDATVGTDNAVTGTLVIDAASIDTKVKKRDAHLRTADFFEIDKYPTIVFDATSATPTADGQWEISGTLTVHGQTNPLSLKADVIAAGSALTVTAVADVDRTRWGLNWRKMGAGVQNHVEITAVYRKA